MNTYITPRTPELEAVARYFSLGLIQSAQKLDNGLVNESFLVRTTQGNFMAQALNGKLWDERVINDYCSVQRYLRTNNLFVPVLLPGQKGSYFYKNKGTLWRGFEYVQHDSVTTVTPFLAAEAGAMLGRFHTLMARSSFTPTFILKGFHDTSAIRQRLQTVARLPAHREKAMLIAPELAFLEKTIETHYLPTDAQKIVIHGDPKIDNFLFREGKPIALLDLDTMMYASPLLDIGDAFRSWCRRKPASSEFLPEVFGSAFSAYNTTAPFQYTFAGVKSAMGLITLELASRYLTDYFEESYFLHKADKYATPAEQNLARCRRYVEYYQNMMAYTTPYQRDE